MRSKIFIQGQNEKTGGRKETQGWKEKNSCLIVKSRPRFIRFEGPFKVSSDIKIQQIIYA
jgi:hypothetical protein